MMMGKKGNMIDLVIVCAVLIEIGRGENIALMSIGAYGHLNPLSAMGTLLHQRGHRINYVLPDSW